MMDKRYVAVIAAVTVVLIGYMLTRRTTTSLTSINTPALTDTSRLQWFYWLKNTIPNGINGPTAIPASCWRQAASNAPNEILMSDGTIIVPFNGVYAFSFNVQFDSAATNPQSWWTIIKSSGLSLTNNPTLNVNTLGNVANGTAHFIATLSAGDVLMPTVSSSSQCNVLTADQRASLNIVMLYRT